MVYIWRNIKSQVMWAAHAILYHNVRCHESVTLTTYMHYKQIEYIHIETLLQVANMSYLIT